MNNITFAKRLASSLMMLVLTASFIVGQTGGDAISKDKTGILLLAHGGRQNWNEEVSKLAASVDKSIMIETAFGMATKRNIQNAVDKLIARGAERIVAVPLFVSSNSSVVTSTEYLLGRRAEAPSDLAIFAKMDHGSDGHSSHGAHGAAEASHDPMTPVKSSVPILMSPALNDHDIVAQILTSRATALSLQPKAEVVILVAHGPVSDETNRLWLADMASLANNMRSSSAFKRIEYLTVRDDAPEPIRSKATEELRAVVKRAHDEKSKVLIVPLLISYGGIEEGIKKRLDGLEYTMAKQALLPDERLIQWVLSSVKNAEAKP